jgi:hypothetical protein
MTSNINGVKKGKVLKLSSSEKEKELVYKLTQQVHSLRDEARHA